ncbi:MAG: 5-(carboxyamino)imidazole ribonucleotide mutase [Clostridia bacterium]|jgi:5-(carboxyamino)imidazole ribonucleotide mutase|nr:5-(carboxyamino)imidazole ribonucleotide mutase [Clostridiales bacterium]
MNKVAILMGSKSDIGVVKEAYDVLSALGVKSEMRVISAHRTPDEAHKFALQARDNGYSVIICAAGKAAHLAGVIAAYTTLPVIGIPIKSSTLDGLDSLLSTVQMPSGVPVATVAVDGAKNAGLLAAEILSISDKELALKLKEMREEMKRKISEDDEKIFGEFH